LPGELSRRFLRFLSFLFDVFIERIVSYLKRVSGEPGPKDVMDV
jgi:hypothetical protein